MQVCVGGREPWKQLLLMEALVLCVGPPRGAPRTLRPTPLTHLICCHRDVGGAGHHPSHRLLPSPLGRLTNATPFPHTTETWEVLDSSGEGFIEAQKITSLLCAVPPPLGVHGLDHPAVRVQEMVMEVGLELAWAWVGCACMRLAWAELA